MERQYKDSGIEWIGSIPETWEVLQIRRFMRNRSERNQPDAMILSLYRDLGVVPKSSRDDNHNVTSEDTANYKVVSKGNFVINKMKAWQGSMAVSDYDGIVSPAYYVCTFTRDVYKRYIHYLLRDASYKPEYMRLSTGMRIGQWDLNIDDFLRIKAILPPLSEQQHIADYLDKKCEEIDSLIGLQEQMIEKLKAYKQSVITEAVTKGLNPDVEFVPSGIVWIGEIPENWITYRIKYNTFLKGRIGWQGLNSNDFIDEGYCLITGTDFDNKGGINWNTCYRISKERFEEDELLHVKEGDLLMTKDGTVGKMAFIKSLPEEASLNSHLLIIRQTTKLINNSFLYWIMLSDIFKRFCLHYQSGSIMNSVSQSTLGLFSCYCPPLSEQQAIASYLDEKCGDIDRLIALKQQKIETLKEYKKSLIYEAVTGKIDLTA